MLANIAALKGLIAQLEAKDFPETEVFELKGGYKDEMKEHARCIRASMFDREIVEPEMLYERPG